MKRRGLRLSAVLLIGVSSSMARPVGAAAGPPGFRLLAPEVTIAGSTRSQLLVAGYTAKVLSSKDRIATTRCADRPQFGDSAAQKALAGKVFTLPAQLGRTMACTMARSSVLMIDHIGVICNDSTNHRASVDCIEKRFEDLRNVKVTVDGFDVGVQRYRVVTEQFVVDLEHDSPFGLNAGKWRLRAGGWPVLLTDVSPGDHVIETSYRLGKNRQKTTVRLTVTG